MNFITQIRDKYGHEIKNSKEIAKNYLKSWFLLDLISSIPTANLLYWEIIKTSAS